MAAGGGGRGRREKREERGEAGKREEGCRKREGEG